MLSRHVGMGRVRRVLVLRIRRLVRRCWIEGSAPDTRQDQGMTGSEFRAPGALRAPENLRYRAVSIWGSVERAVRSDSNLSRAHDPGASTNTRGRDPAASDSVTWVRSHPQFTARHRVSSKQTVRLDQTRFDLASCSSWRAPACWQGLGSRAPGSSSPAFAQRSAGLEARGVPQSSRPR